MLMLLTCLCERASAQLRINEILAKNSATAVDPDFGEFADFVELHNAGPAAINLKDFTLTDNPNNKTKWKFPAITLQPGEYLLLWADGQNKYIGDTAFSEYLNKNIVTKNLHLNYKLSGDGEYLGIYNLNLQVVDEIYFGVQEDDISFGRSRADANEWHFFSESTPGAANSTFSNRVLSFAEVPVLSVNGGFYPSAQTLSFSSPSPNASIRFTFDGSTPTENSQLAPASFNVIRNYTVKARAYEPGKLPSKVVTHTYFIGENLQLPVISISSNNAHLYGFDFGIYRNGIKDREIPAVFEYYDENKQLISNTGIGLRIFGTTIFALPQRPLSIRFRSKFGDEELNYPLFPDRENTRFQSIQLRNGGNDYNISYFRDGLATSMIKGQMDIDYQAYKPCVVFINGEFMGIYEIRERLDEDHLAKNHLIDADNIDMLEDSSVVVAGTAQLYERMLSFINNNDLSEDANYQQIIAQIDVDEYLNHMIQRVFIGYQIADYNNKYWRSRESGSRWRWFAHDMEHAFGQIAGDAFFENTLSKVSGQSGNLPEWSVVLFRNLLKNKTFHDEYAQRMAIYLKTLYNPARTTGLADSLKNLLSSQMSRHIFRWNTPASIVQWNNNINFIKDFLNKRPAFVRQHVAGQFGLSDSALVRLEIQGKGKFEAAGVLISDTVFSVHLFKGAALSLQALPDPDSRFIRWEGIDGDSSFVLADIVSDTVIRVIFEDRSISIIPPLVDKDTILAAAASPWYGLEDILILPGARLIVEPGAELLLTDGISFIVQGGLHLNGTADKRILMRSDPSPAARRFYFGQSGFWGSIIAENPSDSVVIRYADIRNGSLGKNRNLHYSTISTFNAPLLITHSTIREGKAPLVARGGSAYIGFSEIYTPVSCNGFVSLYDMDNPVIEHCIFNGNRAFDTDAIDIKGVNNGMVRHNTVKGFTGINSDGIDLGIYSKDILIEHNIIHDCFDKGISIGSQSTGIIRRNVIYGCDLGVAVKDSFAIAFIDQNTFFFNRHDVACYEKSTTRGGGKAFVKNSILSATNESNISFDSASEITVNFSLSDSKLLPGEGNLLAEPQFINPSTGNFELSITSPCIDSGDPDSPLDPDNSRADMGAYYQHQGPTQLTVLINEFAYLPPSNYYTGDWVEIYNSTDTAIDLKGWSLRQGMNTFDFETSQVLMPDDYLVLTADSATFRKYYPGNIRILGDWDFDLNDVSGAITLQDDQQQLVHYVRYANTWPSPPLAAGKGATVELEPSAQGNRSFEWRESYVLNGTPGQSNSTRPDISGLFINEVMASNGGFIKDEFGENDDWFEIYNSGDSPVNIGGLYVSDNRLNPQKWQVPLNQPEQTTIPAKGFLLLWADEQPEQGPLHADFKLSASGEETIVFQRSGADFLMLEELRFGVQNDEQTFGRFPDGSDTLSTMWPTPGGSNALTSIHEQQLLTLKTYPNPFKDVLFIDMSWAKTPYNITVTNAVGAQVNTTSGITDERFTLQRHGWASGIYILHIRDADGRMLTGKVVAQ
jgi:hypothetical protein